MTKPPLVSSLSVLKLVSVRFLFLFLPNVPVWVCNFLKKKKKQQLDRANNKVVIFHRV